MKHVFSVLSVASVAFFTLFLSTTNVSCKKGDTGPKGDTGVANAVYSAWKTVTFGGAVLQTGDTVGVATITAPEITNDVLNKGTVHVYANFGTTAAPDIVPIPYLDVISSIWVNVDYELGKIHLVSNIDASAPYRYIVLTGSVPASGGRQATINWNDYAEVKKALNLKD
ncbi:hypothetical protein A4D02_12700 [Niastella koreensis]|uniref:Uncharacterized protein n=2 Tax=Niastella koreensis TaxID=354356 RepID=G8TKX1_NIAKG|nr:hypothetical protein [Niastella koreensis]AEW00810.1 hypothetical protein Niako_4552 [Niastella koreensis GR20-10]OQP42427.1 hypothetical protein A4D02_12700 [Niastella koreensis]